MTKDMLLVLTWDDGADDLTSPPNPLPLRLHNFSVEVDPERDATIELHLTRDADRFAPFLGLACADGRVFTTVELRVIGKADDDADAGYFLRLFDARLYRVNVSGSSLEDRAFETLMFSAMEFDQHHGDPSASLRHDDVSSSLH